MKSIWEEDEVLPRFSQLDGDADTDVLIIGGGLAGLMCAYSLHRAGADCLLVEADTVCGGVTAGTTAKVTAQHGLYYDALKKKLGKKAAELEYRANTHAIAALREIAAQTDCDWTDCSSLLYTGTDVRPLRREFAALEKLGAEPEWVESAQMPFPISGAVRLRNQAQFHPLKFAAGIARGLNIREHTRITGFDGAHWHTERGTIAAKKTIIATHFPIWNKHGLYWMKLHQERSYVLSLTGAELPEDMYIGAGKSDVTIRTYGPQLILSGSSHRTGQSSPGWKPLEEFAARYYPNARIAARWAAQDCTTLDGLPYVGKYAVSTPDLYVATGFHEWGMTASMTAAQILTDTLQGRQNPVAALYDPSRDMLWGQLASNVLHSAAGVLTLRRPRCPHLGCALRWNAHEHSWDCPCHGSRFSEDGHLLNEPATDDMH